MRDVAFEKIHFTASEVALAGERVQSWTADKTVRKVIARPPKLVNIVVA